MNNNFFSLCLLPDKARIHIIKSLKYPELIALSLLSTKFTSLVQSFKLEFKHLSVNIEDDSLSVHVYYGDNLGLSSFKIYNDVIAIVPGGPLVTLDEVPIFIQTFSYLPGYDCFKTFTWANPGLSFIGWFEHLRSIFIFSESLFNVHIGKEMFDTVAIRKLRPEWTSVVIDHASLNVSYTLKICELFSACTKALATGSIDNLAQFPQKFAIQNYDHLNIPFTLDDALLSNSLDICLSNFTIFDFNRFIKSWIRGSNSRLRKVYMHPRGEIVDEKLLKGVQHQIMPENLERIWNEDEPIAGGIDFRNKKGISATLIIKRGNVQLIQIFVWN